MDKYHPRSNITPLLFVIITFLSSCCTHKDVTRRSNGKSFLSKEVKDSSVTNKDSLLLSSLQDVNRILLYTIASPQQKDSLLKDTIGHYKVYKAYGKVSTANTAIFNFLMKEDGLLCRDYPPVKQMFFPYCALKCYKGKETYTLLYSLGTEEIRILKQGQQEETYKIHKIKTMLHWLNQVLPNDEYIKSLSKWKQ